MNTCHMTESQSCWVTPLVSLFLSHSLPLKLRVCVWNQKVLGIIIPNEIPSVLRLSNGGKSFIQFKIFLQGLFLSHQFWLHREEPLWIKTFKLRVDENHFRGVEILTHKTGQGPSPVFLYIHFNEFLYSFKSNF